MKTARGLSLAFIAMTVGCDCGGGGGLDRLYAATGSCGIDESTTATGWATPVKPIGACPTITSCPRYLSTTTTSPVRTFRDYLYRPITGFGLLLLRFSIPLEPGSVLFIRLS